MTKLLKKEDYDKRKPANSGEVIQAVNKIVSRLKAGKAPAVQDLEALENAQHPSERRAYGSDAYMDVVDPASKMTVSQAMSDLRNRIPKIEKKSEQEEAKAALAEV